MSRITQKSRYLWLKDYMEDRLRKANASRILITKYFQFKTERFSVEIKWNLHRVIIRSIMTIACPVWQLVTDTCVVKLQRSKNRLLQEWQIFIDHARLSFSSDLKFLKYCIREKERIYIYTHTYMYIYLNPTKTMLWDKGERGTASEWEHDVWQSEQKSGSEPLEGFEIKTDWFTDWQSVTFYVTWNCISNCTWTNFWKDKNLILFYMRTYKKSELNKRSELCTPVETYYEITWQTTALWNKIDNTHMFLLPT